VDMFKPHLYPMNMPAYRIAYFANGQTSTPSWWTGKVLMEGRKVRTVDEAGVLEFAQNECEAMLDRVGLRDLLGSRRNSGGTAGIWCRRCRGAEAQGRQGERANEGARAAGEA